MSDDELPKSILKSLGYKVTSRATSAKKEADFLVEYESCVALVEAKIKSDATAKTIQKENALEQGNIFVSEAVRGRNETVSGVIRNASRQLRSSFSHEYEFSMLIYIATGINARTKCDQIFDTIYGSSKIIEYKKPPAPKTCYFFRNSDFFSRKEYLDAAIVGYLFNKEINVLMCLNPYSERYNNLRNSKFLLPFKNAVIDPFLLEKRVRKLEG
jgi:hypothetical protein